MRIDAHQHFWNYSKDTLKWINDDMKALKKDQLPGDLKPLVEKKKFDGTIAVQLTRSPEENKFLLGLADQHDWIKGVIGWLDLREDDLKSRLEKLSKNPLFKGIRYNFQHERDPNGILDYQFNLGVSYLKDYDLAFEILIHQGQMDNALEFIQRHPYTKLVLNDIAKPPIKPGDMEPWKSKIHLMAECENLYCKVSGLLTLADWKKWKEKEFYPYLDVAFEAFGSERIIFGSDWPICMVAGTYDKSVDLIEKYIKKLPKEEQEAVMGKNAEAFYNIAD